MSTISKLRADANRIANETTEGANTASRIGALYNGIIDFLEVLNEKEYDYDDSELRQAINNIDQAINDLDNLLADVLRLANEERNRLNDLLNQLDNRIRGKVDDMLGDAAVIQSHAEVIQQGLEGQIQWQSEWDENIEAYLQEVGVWAREGDVIKTQWSQIVQDVDSIENTVAEVQQDLRGRPTSTQWSELVQKANSIEQAVNKLIYQGDMTEALQSSISETIDDKVASLNLETTYAKIDTEKSKDIIQWMYSALKNETSEDRTYDQIYSAGKSGLKNGISEVRTYVETVKNGGVLDFVAYSDLESKVNDSITGLYNKASASEASTTIFSQVKKDSQDIAAIVTSATGDSSSASIATKFQNWKAGLIIRSEFNAAVAELVTHNELSGAVSGLISKAYVDDAVTNLISRIGTATSAVNLHSTLKSAYGELVTANNINNYTSAFVTESTLNSAVAKMVAKNDYNAASITAMVNNSGSEVRLNADKINFTFTQATNFISGNKTVMSLDGQGNLSLTGEITATKGSITGNIAIGTGTKKMYIEPLSTGARLVGKDGSYETLHLGFRNYNGSMVPAMYLNAQNGLNTQDSTIRIMSGSDFAEVLAESAGSTGAYHIIRMISYPRYGYGTIEGNKWPKRSDTTVYNRLSNGAVYVEDGYLKVKGW